jgi:hypothetical protein
MNAYSELEEPVRELSLMASIMYELGFDAFDSPVRNERKGAYVVISIHEHDHERILFVVSKVAKMAMDLEEKYRAEWKAARQSAAA